MGGFAYFWARHASFLNKTFGNPNSLRIVSIKILHALLILSILSAAPYAPAVFARMDKEQPGQETSLRTGPAMAPGIRQASFSQQSQTPTYTDNGVVYLATRG